MGDVDTRKFALALRKTARQADTDPSVPPMVMVEVTPLLAKKIANALLRTRPPAPRGGR